MSFLIIHSSQVFEGVLYCDLVRQRVQIMEVTVLQKNDLVTSRPLKDSTSITSGPLSTIFNASIIQDFYPNCWKKGRVTSAFKKWYRNWQPNCCQFTYCKYFSCQTELLEHGYYGCSNIKNYEGFQRLWKGNIPVKVVKRFKHTLSNSKQGFTRLSWLSLCQPPKLQ